MTTRVLPPEEWSRLETDGTYLKNVWRVLNPAYVTVLVVEDAGRIVGTWVAQLQMHVEGFWIDPAHRLAGDTLRALEVGMADLLARIGCSTALTEAKDAQIERFLKRRDATPVNTYRIPFQARADRTRGHAFHLELHASGLDLTHDTDDAHDINVGQALRIAFEEGDPTRAVTHYNAWASTAGYEPISGWHDDGAEIRVSFGTLAPISLTKDGHVCPLPPSS